MAAGKKASAARARLLAELAAGLTQESTRETKAGFD